VPGRQAALAQTLAVLRPTGGSAPRHPRPSAKDLQRGGVWEEAIDVYRQLGGIRDKPSLRPGAWDVSLAGLAVELDEEQHFNRYRTVTLGSHIYHRFVGFDGPVYRRYCDVFEADCARRAGYRGYWTSPSSARDFGLSGSPGDLSSEGSSRWKQRAFYDYVKDLAPLCGGPVVVRMSVWDSVTSGDESRTVGEALKRIARDRQSNLVDAVRQLVEEKIARAVSG
jgi:hypothetical protein